MAESSQREFVKLIEEIRIPAFITDSEGVFLAGNSLFTGLLKYDQHELTEEGFDRAVHKKDARILFHKHIQKILQKSLCNFRLSFLAKNNQMVICSVSGALLRDTAGNPSAIIFHAEEIRDNRFTLYHKLKDTETRFKISQKFADFGTWDWNIETDTLWWSEKVGPLLGYENESIETTFQNFIRCIHPDDKLFVMNAVRNAVKLNKKYNLTHRCIKKNGETGWIHGAAEVIHDNSGKAVRMIGVIQDVTDHHNIETEFKINKERLKEAQSLGKMCNWMRSQESQIIDWSDEIQDLFGCSPEAINSIGLLKKFISDEDLQRIQEIEAKVLETGNRHGIDHRVRMPDGSIKWVHQEISVAQNQSSGILSLTGTLQDISTQKELEKTADEKNKLLELIYRGTSAFLENQEFREVSDLLLNGLLDLCDSKIGMISSFDYESGETPRVFVHAVRWKDGIQKAESLYANADSKNYSDVNGDAILLFNKIVERVLNEEKPILSNHFSSENDFEINNFLAVPVFRNNLLVGMYLVANSRNGFYEDFLNILKPFNVALSVLFHSEKMNQNEKEIRNNIQNAKISAEKASRAKSDFLAHVSHELRNPLNSILGFAQLMQGGKDLPPRADLYSNQILHSGRQLLKLVDDLLQLISIEEDSLSPKIENLSVYKIVHDVVSTLERSPEDSEIEIRYSSLDDSYFISGDCLFVKDILQNLISNALKYNHQKGLVSIDAEFLRDEGIIRISVSDTGEGIPPDKRYLLFMPFERLGKEMSLTPGTGIGLFIAKRLVEMLSGNIDFESIPGEGSRFWVDLPVSRVMLDHENRNSGKSFEESLDLNILYIEDEQLYHKLIHTIFRKYSNCSVHSCLTGREGLVLARSLKPDLIFLDIVLPDINGFEVLAYIKSDANLKDVPVVGISAHFSKEDMNAALKAGFYDVLTKPLPSENIQPILKKVSFLKNKKEA